jgi:hypothetical protein
MSPYPIPSTALDDRLAWLGTAGSGKTYNAGAGVEQLLASGARVVIVDPLDVWWGLRLMPDGERPSRFKLPIFGGARGDLPLTENAGGLIGETVAGMAESCIVSLGGLPTKAAERRFMLAFLTALYRHQKGEPLHLVLDEADLWAPQLILDKEGEAPKLKGMMEQIVRRGRVRGFIPWLITQRPAVLSKDVLSQADGLIAFKLTSSQDRDAIGAWIEGQADRAQGREILASLPTMQQGQGVVWVPGRGILDTAQFPQKVTFDSSRTPTRGEIVRTATLKPLDLGALQDRLGKIEAETKANDPAALKAEVQRLTRELAKAEKAKAAPPPAPPPVVVNAEEVAEARRQGELAGIAIGIARAQQALLALRVDGAPIPSAKPARAPQPPLVAPEPMAAVVPAQGLNGPQQRILDAIAWWGAFGIERPVNEQVAFISGYSPTSGAYFNPRGALRAAGLIEYPSPNVLALTEAGREKANEPDVVPTREELQRRVLGKLNGPQQRILQPLLEAHPSPLSNDELAAKSGYSPTSGAFFNPRGSLRSLNILEYPSPGMVRAADWLFP